MPKTAIGSMRQKTLIEGDENLLERNEILVKDSEDFSFVLKERDDSGSIKTSVVVPIEQYLKSLKDAYNEGVAAGKKQQKKKEE